MSGADALAHIGYFTKWMLNEKLCWFFMLSGGPRRRIEGDIDASVLLGKATDSV